MASKNAPSTCLFLPELPPDISDPILERQFRGYEGYSSCRTRKDRNGKLVGFVEFEQVDDAIRCREHMQGASPFPGINWHIHFSNNTKGGPAASGGSGGPPSAGKRPREEMAAPVPRHEAQRPSYGAMMPLPAYEPRGYAPSPSSTISPYYPQYAAHRPTPPPPAYHPSDPMAYQPAPTNYAALALPPEATSTLYIEGLPAARGAVAHVFRRYDGHGFQSVRMRPIESKNNPGTSLFLCFAEFDNAHQATIALHGLQGYRFDLKADGSGIRISYAKSKGRGGGGGGAPPPPARAATADERAEQHGARRRGYSYGREPAAMIDTTIAMTTTTGAGTAAAAAAAAGTTTTTAAAATGATAASTTTATATSMRSRSAATTSSTARSR